MKVEPGAAPETPPRAPREATKLFAWVEAVGLGAWLDHDASSFGEPPTGLPTREGVSFRQAIAQRTEQPEEEHEVRYDVQHGLRARLQRMADLRANAEARRRWIAEHGRDPEDDVLASFLAWLERTQRELRDAGVVARADEVFEPVELSVERDPVPLVRMRQVPLRSDAYMRTDDVALLLLAWDAGPARFATYRNDRATGDEVPPSTQLNVLELCAELVRDPRAEAERELLAELLRIPAWQHALGTLDGALARLGGTTRDPVAERIAYRVTTERHGEVTIVPLLQKRGRGGSFSRGSRVDWFNLTQKANLLGDADRRVFAAYDDRFARRSGSWSGPLAPAQVFAMLRALEDHPAVFLEGGSERRADIRHGRLRLCFDADADGGLTPRYELVGASLSPAEVARAARDGRHVIVLRPSDDGGQVLLAQLSPEAHAFVAALAEAPARFPPESHDALALRLEPLQQAMDVELPSRWTRTIAEASPRVLARLEVLASGALKVVLAVQPVKLGPVWPPGIGPALVLEGHGRARHGVRRDLEAEQQAARAVAERIGLRSGDEVEAWCWRVPEGDAALGAVEALQAMGDAIVVQWASEQALLTVGSIGRRDVRLKVGESRDWFAVEGGATVAGEEVPLAQLLAAIRDGRRFVAVGKRGFARIEETLRRALELADAALEASRSGWTVAPVHADPLVGLVEDEAQIEAADAWKALRARMRSSQEEKPQLPPALEASLRPYQRAGVEWLVRLGAWGAGAVLADEMGLGKTIQTLALLTHRGSRGPALVVAPTSVVGNWVTEAARFTPELRVRLFRGADRERGLVDLGPRDVVVTSYTLAALEADALAKPRFATLVLDEAQALKNAATERSKALRRVDAELRVALTGTPIENHLGELWSLFRIVEPGLFGSWERFRGRFAIPIEKYEDRGRRRSLADLLRPFMLRRTKAAVAPQLPSRTDVVRAIVLSAEEQALYEQLRTAVIRDLEDAERAPERNAQEARVTMLAALTRLRQLCCHPRLVYPHTTATSSKLAHLEELLTELREGGHRALVFSQFRSFLELIAPRLRQRGFDVLVLDGTTPAEERERRVAAFQAGEADVFLVSLKAGGFGLNLTAADHVIHLDPWWNPAVEEQATARAHRIGQERPVTAVRLVAQGTVEEAVLALHASKRELAAAVLEGTATAAGLSNDELLALLQRSAARA